LKTKIDSGKVVLIQSFMTPIIGERIEFSLETYLAFIDYEKASDKVRRHISFKVLQEINLVIRKLNDNMAGSQSVNQGIWQGGHLSTTLLDIHMNEMIIHWKEIYWNGTEINDETILNALLFTDVLVCLSDLEDLQRILHTLHNIQDTFEWQCLY